MQILSWKLINLLYCISGFPSTKSALIKFCYHCGNKDVSSRTNSVIFFVEIFLLSMPAVFFINILHDSCKQEKSWPPGLRQKIMKKSYLILKHCQ